MKEMVLYTAGVKDRPNSKKDNWTVKLSPSKSVTNFKVTDKKHPLYGVEFINQSTTLAWSTVSAQDAEKIGKHPDIPIRVLIADDYDPNGGNRCIVIGLGE